MSLLPSPPPSRPALTAGFALAALAVLAAAARHPFPGLVPVFWALFGAAALACALRMLRGRRPGASAHSVERGVVLALAAVAVWSVFLHAADRLGQNALTALADPLQINPMEGREAVKAWLLATGRPIYSDLKGFDYIVTLYGPVYYAVTALAMRLFGPSLAVARGVSLLAGMGALAAAGLLLHRLTRRPGAALVAVLALCGAPLMEYAYLARPDMTGWAFFLTALALAAPGSPQDQPGRFRLALAGAALALAALTKQQTWPFCLAALVFLLAQGRMRRVVLPVALSFGLWFLAGLAVLLVWTDGRFFWQTVVFPKHMAALAGGNSFAVAVSRLKDFAGEYSAPLVLFALYLVFAARTRRTMLPALLALLPLPLTVTALCWSGADKNHLLGLVLALYLGLGALLARMSAVPGWGPLLSVAALAVLAPLRLDVPGGFGPDRGRVADHAAMACAVVAAAAESGSPLLGDAEGAYLFLGRPEFAAFKLFDSFETDVMAQVRLWNPKTSDLAAAIRQRRFSAVFQATTHVDQHVSGLLDTFYQPWRTIGDMTLRRPRPGRAVLTVDDFRPDPLLAGPVTLRLAGFDNLQFDGDAVFDHIKLKPGCAEGRMTLRVESAAPLDAVTLLVSPRLQRPEDGFSVQAQGPGRPEAFWTFTRDKPGPASPFEGRLECRAQGRGEALTFTLTLSGTAELWFSPDRPVALVLEETPPPGAAAP